MDALTLITIIVAACCAVYFALKAKSKLGNSRSSDAELLAVRNEIAALQAAATEEARRTTEADTRLQEIRRQFEQAAAECDRLREVEKELVEHSAFRKNREIKSRISSGEVAELIAWRNTVPRLSPFVYQEANALNLFTTHRSRLMGLRGTG